MVCDVTPRDHDDPPRRIHDEVTGKNPEPRPYLVGAECTKDFPGHITPRSRIDRLGLRQPRTDNQDHG